MKIFGWFTGIFGTKTPLGYIRCQWCKLAVPAEVITKTLCPPCRKAWYG